MVSTRSKKTDEPQAGDKRSAPTDSAPAKKPKTKDGHLQANDNGEIGLKDETKEESGEGEKGEETVKVQYQSGDTEEISQEEKAKRNEKDQKAREVEQERGKPQEATEKQQSEVHRSGKGETKQEGDEIDLEEEGVAGELEEPKHGTLESGHVYFLYRPKIDVDEVDSIDDVSKFHILLIPNSPPYDKGHYHRIIEVGKKRLPDPNAKRSVMWGLVGNTGEDKSKLKDAFGAYDYDTKTRGKRHQPAARPAARGHYILHSPRDEKADDPNTDRQRDFKLLLAYEITTPVHADFGAVQEELGIEEKGAVLLQVKDPDVESGGNPRAASLPRDKRAQYPPGLKELFGSRRWIPANPPSLLNYSGAEVLVLTSPHELADSLGKDGEKVEDDLDKDAEQESVSIDEAMKEMGMSKRETELEALEGEWA